MHKGVDKACMSGQYPCMALKTIRTPKVQRGLSLQKDLYERIVDEADKYGRTWNETVELVLSRAFSTSLTDSRNKAETMNERSEDRIDWVARDGE
jgi:hypothetical protein